MKIKMYFAVTLLAIISMCFGARLDNTYLPPGSAGTAGGAGLIPAPRPGVGGGIGSGVRPGVSGGGIGSGGRPGNNAGGYSGDIGLGGGIGGGGGRPIGGGNVRPGAGGQVGAGSSQEIPIVNFSNENNGDGNYAFSYETGNGITAQETGQSQGDAGSVSGSYSYTGPDGVQYTITYTADADGFHPQGAHIPTPPPIPPEIQRGVELALAAEARGENQDGGSTGGQGTGSGSGGRGAGGYGQVGVGQGGQGGGFGGGQSGGQGFGFGGAVGGGGVGTGAPTGTGNRGSGSAYQGPNSYQTSSHAGYQY